MITRSRCSLSARRLLMVAGLTMALSYAAVAQTTVSWTGGGDGFSWSDVRNWSPQVVPVNAGAERYVVVIPASRSVVVGGGLPPTFAVDSITLAATSTMTLTSGRVVTVSSQQGLSGVVRVSGGGSLNVVTLAGGVSGTLAPSYLETTDASQFVTTGSGYTLSMGQTGRTVLRAAGVGSLLDLSGATQLQFATPTQAGSIAQGIQADRGIIDLSGITSINAQGNVIADLRAATNGVIRMPLVTELNGANVNLSSGGQIQVGALTSFNSSSVDVFGSSFTLSSGVTSVTQRRTLSLSAREGVIDMSSLTAIRLDPNAGATNGAGQYLLNAENGGRIDLSRLVTLDRRVGANVTVRSMTGATVNLSSLRALPNAFIEVGGGTILTPSLTDITGSLISVTDGGQLLLPGVTSITTSAASMSSNLLVFGGVTSRLDLSNLATITVIQGLGRGVGMNVGGGTLTLPVLRTIATPNGGSIQLSVAAGGRFVIPALTALPSSAGIVANGAGASVELGSLQSISQGRILLEDGGTLLTPQLRSLSNVDFSSRNGQFDASTLTTVENMLLSVRQGTFDLPAGLTQASVRNVLEATFAGVIRFAGVRTLTVLPGQFSGLLNLSASEGGLIDLPVMDVLDVRQGTSIAISARFPGSRLSMPAIRSLDGVSSFLVSGAGARIDVPLLESITTPFRELTLSALEQSVLDLRSLTTVPGDTRWNVTAQDGGVVLLDRIATLGTATSSLVAERGGRIDLPLVTTLTNVTVRLSDPSSSINFGALQSVERSAFQASGGARLTLPSNLTRFTVPSRSGGTQFLGTHSLGEIDASSVLTLAYGASASDSFTYQIGASGGLIDLRSLNAFEVTGSAALNVIATTRGLVNLTGARTLPARVNVETQPGQGTSPSGIIDLSGLSVLNAGVSRTFTSWGIESQVRLDSLANISDGAGATSFSVRSGGALRLPLLQSLGNSASVEFDAMGSALQLPSLTDLGSGGSRGFRASDGGTLTVPALTTFGAAATVSVSSTGAGSLVSLPALTSLGSGVERRFSIFSGAGISAPQLSVFTGVTLSIEGVGAALTLGQVSNIDGTTLRVGEGATFAVPAGVTSYSTGSRGSATILEARTGSVIDASSLTSIRHGSASAASLSHSITAAIGTVRLSNVTSTTAIGGGRLVLAASSNGVIDLSSLTALNNADVTWTSGGQLRTGVLTSIDGSTFTNWSTTPFVLPAGVRSYSTNGYIPPSGSNNIFRVLNPVAELNLASLETLTYGGDVARTGYRVSASGGLIDLSGLRTLVPVNGAVIDFSASGTGRVLVPGITDLNGVSLEQQSSGQVVTGALTSISGGSITVQDGAQFVLPSTITDYSPRANRNATMNAVGTGSRLDLSALRSVSFGSTDVDGNTTTFRAVSGGTIDLSGVSTLTRLRDGFLLLRANGGGTISAPQVTRLNFATVEQTFGTITLGALTNFDNTIVRYASGVFEVSPEARSYTNTANGAGTVFLASSNALISLPGLTSLRLGSESAVGVVRTIAAANSGAVNLSSIRSIELVNGARLAIEATSGGTVDFGSLTRLIDTNVSVGGTGSRLILQRVTEARGSTLTATGSGVLTMSGLNTIDARERAAGNLIMATGGGAIVRFPALRTIQVGSSTEAGVVQTVRAENNGDVTFATVPDVQSVNGGALRVSISSATVTMPRATVSSLIRYEIFASSSTSAIGLVLGGLLANESVNPTDFNGSRGNLNFLPGTVASLEAAGLNLGTAGTRASNAGNFGLAQLRLGATGLAPAVITVGDNFDNGQRANGREALYLFGPTFGTSPGLFLLNGSRLIIGDNTDVFSSINGVMTNLRSLIPLGHTQVTYGGGFLVIPSPSVAGVMVLAGLVAGRRRR